MSQSSAARAALRARHRGPGVRRRARGDQRHRRARRRGPARSAGTRRSSAPGPGSSARRAATATAGSPRSTTPTPRSRSGCRRWSAPRLSSSDPRPRHRGLSHHSATVLDLLLAPVRVPVRRRVEGWPLLDRGSTAGPPDELTETTGGAPRLAPSSPIDLDGYAASGLPTRTMGRSIGEDPLFFAAPLAAWTGACRRGGGVGARAWSGSDRAPCTRARSPTCESTSSATRTARPPSAQVVAHPGAVTIIAHDDEHVWLVRQPREPVEEEALLELPAGKLDVEGEPPLECAKRELVEEIGKSAGSGASSSASTCRPGSPRRRCGSSSRPISPTPSTSRIPRSGSRSSPWPLADLDGAIGACADSKSLVGLLLLRDACSAVARLHGRGASGGRENSRRMAVAVQKPRDAPHRRALRGARPRLPRLPGVRARPGPQHARRLPQRSLPVRRLPRQARSRRDRGGARRRRRLPRRPRDRRSGGEGRTAVRGRRARRRRSPARPPACALSTATCAARSSSTRTRPRR